MPPLRIGILGAGRVPVYAMLAPARAHPEARVVAVASRDPQRAREYAGLHGIERAHASYAELVADPEVDLVYVATPPRCHAELARLAIAAGKPVLIEKPFAMDAGEAEALLADARAAGVPIFEAMHSCHHSLWAMIDRLLPRLGSVIAMDAVFDTPVRTDEAEFRWDASLGGGALMDLGIYPLAWVRRIAGEPLAVTAATMRRERSADAAVTASLSLPGGVTARISADMTAPRRARLTITGIGGALIVDNPLAPQLGHHVTYVSGQGSEVFTATGPGSYDVQLAAVIATLRHGAPFPLPADDPRASMRAIDMVRAAVEG
jgi:predicted dehydrogenase